MTDQPTAAFDAGVLTIFGITGDLAARKLLPSIYRLLEAGQLPEHFIIMGVSRSETTVEELMSNLALSLRDAKLTPSEAVMTKLTTMIRLKRMDMADPADFIALGEELQAIEESLNVCLNRLFYLAVPAAAFGPIIDALGTAWLNRGCRHEVTQSRLLLEKPFGSDLASAQALIDRLRLVFDEQQIYRIDHYLAKETTQNILTFRFQNPLFRATWDERLIDHITITAAEAIGIEGRADFYEQTGALRDLVQSHLLQLLAVVTMDEPAEPTAEAIHREKQKLLESIKPMTPEQVATMTVRGQYEGYQEETAHPDSTTETYAALQLAIDNERWYNVPILLRTGKALADKVTEITVAFRQEAHPQAPANTLTIRIQPNEGIVLNLLAKQPGFDNDMQTVQMDFCYHTSFDGLPPDAYERVIADAFRGDQTLFATSEEELATWAVIQPILDGWASGTPKLIPYPKASWGPGEAEALATAAHADWPDETLKVCTIHPSL